VFATDELLVFGDALVADLRRLEAVQGGVPESVEAWRARSRLARVVFDNQWLMVRYQRRGARFYVSVGLAPDRYSVVFIEDSTRSVEWHVVS